MASLVLPSADKKRNVSDYPFRAESIPSRSIYSGSMEEGCTEFTCAIPVLQSHLS